MKKNAQLRHLSESFACVAAAVISADGKTSRGELSRFHNFFSSEFGLNKAESDALLVAGKADLERLDHHLEVLAEVLPANLLERSRFMRYLNDSINKDGIAESEYPLFDKIRDALFD